MQAVQAPPGRVTSGFVIKQLVVDGLLSAADAERFKTTGGRERSGHPLVVLAEMNYRSPQADRQLLDLETLDALDCRESRRFRTFTSIR